MHSSYACDSLSAVVMETQLREHVPSTLIGLVHRKCSKSYTKGFLCAVLTCDENPRG